MHFSREHGEDRVVETKDGSFEKSQQNLKPQLAKGNENVKREKNKYGSNQEEDYGEDLMKAQKRTTAEKYLGLTGAEKGVV